MNKYLLLSLWASLSLLSCQEKKQTVEEVIASNDLEQLRAKRAAIGDQHQALLQDLDALDRAIGKLDQNEKLSLVTALVIAPEVFEHYLQVQADVATKQNIVLYPQFSGQLQTLHVAVGDQVKKGDRLVGAPEGHGVVDNESPHGFAVALEDFKATKKNPTGMVEAVVL